MKNRKRDIYSPPAEAMQVELRTRQYVKYQNNAANAYNCGRSAGNNNKSNSNPVLPFYEFPKDCTREYVTIQELYDAYYDCRKHKRNKKSALKFEMEYEKELVRLHNELNGGIYEISPSIVFCVTRPKTREVFAADFRDRVVHHLLMRRFEYMFESEMIDSSYNCRKNKGVLYGVFDTERQMREVSMSYTREAYILQCDIKGFFMSISREKMWDMVESTLRKNYHEDDLYFWLWLWQKVILHQFEENCRICGDRSLLDKLPPHKSILKSKGMGLPIGNVPSHYLSNLYLTIFDKWAVSYLGRNGRYGRYADDWHAMHPDKDKLLNMISDARKFLREELSLTLHPEKIYLQEIGKGVRFCGAVIKKGRVYVSNSTLGMIYDSIDRYNKGKASKDMLVRSINSYFGLLCHYKTYAIRWRLWKRIKDKENLCNVNMLKLIMTQNRRKS